MASGYSNLCNELMNDFGMAFDDAQKVISLKTQQAQAGYVGTNARAEAMLDVQAPVLAQRGSKRGGKARPSNWNKRDSISYLAGSKELEKYEEVLEQAGLDGQNLLSMTSDDFQELTGANKTEITEFQRLMTELKLQEAAYDDDDALPPMPSVASNKGPKFTSKADKRLSIQEEVDVSEMPDLLDSSSDEIQRVQTFGAGGSDDESDEQIRDMLNNPSNNPDATTPQFDSDSSPDAGSSYSDDDSSS